MPFKMLANPYKVVLISWQLCELGGRFTLLTAAFLSSVTQHGHFTQFETVFVFIFTADWEVQLTCNYCIVLNSGKSQTRSQSPLICSSKAMKDWGEMMSRSCGLPLMQCVLVKTASGATGNESGQERITALVMGSLKWLYPYLYKSLLIIFKRLRLFPCHLTISSEKFYHFSIK